MQEVEHDGAHDAHHGHRKRQESDQYHTDRKKHDRDAVKRGARPVRDFHAFRKIVGFGAGDHDTVSGAVRRLIRFEKIHRGDAVARKRDQKFQTDEEGERDQPREYDVETFWLRRLVPDDIDIKKRRLRKKGRQGDTQEILVGAFREEKAVYQGSGEKRHSDVSEDGQGENHAGGQDPVEEKGYGSAQHKHICQ